MSQSTCKPNYQSWWGKEDITESEIATLTFGVDPEHSVLDADCRAHDVENLFVTDGSFMSTGRSVPFTWTIYANACRVADKIIQQLG